MIKVDQHILSHAIFVARHDIYDHDPVAMSAAARRLAAHMVSDFPADCIDATNADTLAEAVHDIAEQIAALALYIATGEEPAQ